MKKSARNRDSEPHSTPDFIVRVFSIDSDDAEPRFLGTGFFVASNLVITCAHIFKERDNERDLDLDNARICVLSERMGCSLAIAHISLDRSPDYDLALLEMETPHEAHILTMVQGVTKGFESYLPKAKYEFVGYLALDNAVTHWEKPLKYKGPDFRSGNLRAIRLDGGVEHGGSGAPVLMTFGERCTCIGMARISGRYARLTYVTSSDTIADFLEKHDVCLTKTVKAEAIFNTIPVSSNLKIKNPLISQQIANLKSRMRITKYILFALAAISCFSGLTIWKKNKSKSDSAKHIAEELDRAEKKLIKLKALDNMLDKELNYKELLANPILDKCHIKQFNSSRNRYEGKRIIVLSFLGSSSDSTTEGHSAGQNLKRTIENYLRPHDKTTLWTEAHLSIEGIQVDFIDCPVSSRFDAQAIALARQAELIIWGSVHSQTVAGRKMYSISPHSTSDGANFLNHDLASVGTDELNAQIPKQLVPLIDLMIGHYAYDRRRYDIAVNQFEKSLNVIVESEDSWRMFNALINTFIETKKYDIAMDLLEKLKVICAGRGECMANYWFTLAGEAVRQGKKQEALTILEQQALPLVDKINDDMIRIYILMNAAEQYEARGSTQEAFSLANRAATISATSIYDEAKQQEMFISAWLEQKKGNTKAVIMNIEKNLSELSADEKVEERSRALTTLAKAYQASGDLSKAERKYQDSIAIFDKLHNLDEKTSLQVNLGNMWFDAENCEKAITYLVPTIDSLHQLHRFSMEAATLGRLVSCYHKINQPDKKKSTIAKLTDLINSPNKEIQLSSHAYAYLALVFYQIGDLEKPLTFMDRAIDIAKQEPPDGANSLTRLREERSRFEILIKQNIAK